MRRFGLTGYPLTHSWSKIFFDEKFKEEGFTDCSYELFPRPDLTGFREWISTQHDLYGLNVTIPHKISITGLLDEIDGDAIDIGAVNTIKITWNSGKPRLKGYNTDAGGFRDSLPHPLNHRRALVLGSGGASRAVAKVLTDLGIQFKFVSRVPHIANSISYEELSEPEMSDSTLIINTTPLGMYPTTSTFPPIPYKRITSHHLLIDLVYNPGETLFLKKGKEQGAQTANGLRMLQIQAGLTFRIFFSV